MVQSSSVTIRGIWEVIDTKSTAKLGICKLKLPKLSLLNYHWALNIQFHFILEDFQCVSIASWNEAAADCNTQKHVFKDQTLLVCQKLEKNQIMLIAILWGSWKVGRESAKTGGTEVAGLSLSVSKVYQFLVSFQVSRGNGRWSTLTQIDSKLRCVCRSETTRLEDASDEHVGGFIEGFQ